VLARELSEDRTVDAKPGVTKGAHQTQFRALTTPGLVMIVLSSEPVVTFALDFVTTCK